MLARRCKSTATVAIRLSFGQIHFIDFPMQRAAADAEFFGSGGYVAIRGGKRLGNQFLFRLVKIERTRFFPESLSG